MPETYHPDFDPEQHRARGLEIDAAARAAVQPSETPADFRSQFARVNHMIQTGDITEVTDRDINDSAEFLLGAMHPVARVRLISEIINAIEV